MEEPPAKGKTTMEEPELIALPVGAVILDLGPHHANIDSPVVACKALSGRWQVLGTDIMWTSREIAAAARKNVLVVAHNPLTCAASVINGGTP